MKNLLHPKNTINRKTKVLAGIAGVILLLTALAAGFKAMSSWYDTHEVKFNQAIQIKLQSPVSITQRQVQINQIVQVINEIPNPVDLKTDAEKYIYDVFGIENYKVAIAIAKAESGMRSDAININTNNTIDLGLFQINSTHFKQDGCTLELVSTVKGNIDCAYQIFQASGWNPWVTAKTGAYLTYLK